MSGNLITGLILLCAITSCYSAEFGDKASDKWDHYVSSLMTKYGHIGIQTACLPRKFDPPADQPYIGTVVMFHGFTACPDQWTELAQKVSTLGYVVLTPLSVGHGLNYTVKGGKTHDNIDFMPDSHKGYEEFVHIINDIAASAGGERVVVGLSLGGALAAYASVTPELEYDRRILMSPLMHLNSSLNEKINEIVNNIPHLRDYRAEFGRACEVERSLGRGGYCQYRVKHVYGAQDFGGNYFNHISTHTPTKMPTQLISSQYDGTINSETVFKLAKKYNLSAISHCQLPEEAGHSFLSIHDSPKQNKYWKEETEWRVASFIAQKSLTRVIGNGVVIQTSPSLDDSLFHVDQNGELISENYQERRCRVDCTPASCAFVPVA